MIIYLAPKVTDRSLCSLPTALRKRQKGCLFEIAPGRVYRSRSLSKSKVGSYPTISPLPRRISPTGGILSVALSIFFPKISLKEKIPGITRSRVSWCPDFPHSLGFPKVARPSSRMFDFDYFEKAQAKREKKERISESSKNLVRHLHIFMQEHWN